MGVDSWKSLKCYFDIHGHEVSVAASKLTGLEIVAVDGEVVSRRYSFRFCSEHQFAVGGRPYAVRLRTVWFNPSPYNSVELINVCGAVVDSDRMEAPSLVNGDMKWIARWFSWGLVCGAAVTLLMLLWTAYVD
jgi:hypothetical protein